MNVVRERAAKALAADLAGMQRLHDLHARLAGETDLRAALEAIVGAANAFVETGRGCIQLVSDDGERLEMFAWRGWDAHGRFVQHFLHEGAQNACDAARHQRCRVIIEDVANFPPLAGTGDREVALAEGIHATQHTPIFGRNGDLLGVLSNQFGAPHRPTNDQLKFVDMLAWTAADFIERHKTHEALRKSEEKYHSLFETIDEGFCIVELMCDPQGDITNLVLREINAAFARHTGLHDLVGRSVGELMPNLEQYWLAAFMSVAETGQPIRIENYASDMDRWYRVHYSRVGDDGSPFVAAVFNDITQRKHAEMALRESEKRQKFLLALNDALRPLTSPEDVQTTAMRILATHLGVMRAGYYEVDPDQETCWLSARWEEGAPPLPGRMNLSDFGPELAAGYRSGRTLVCRDTEKEMREETVRAAFRAIQVRAWFAVPLVKNGLVVTGVGIHSRTPRNWTPEELGLVEAVAERTWAAAERARAEAALRTSEEKYRSLFYTMGQGYAESEIVRDADGRAVDYRFIEMNPAFERLSGLPIAEAHGRLVREVLPGLEDRWIETADRVVRTGMPERAEYESGPLDRWFQVDFYPAGGERFTVLFENITARKRADDTLRESEERQTYLLALADALRPLADPIAIQREATRILREHLDAIRVAYVEMQEDGATCTPMAEDTGGRAIAPPFDRTGWAGFDPSGLAALHQGRITGRGDVHAANDLTPGQNADLAALGFRAYMAAPLLKDGRLAAFFVAQFEGIHEPARNEILLLEETAARTWDAVQRTRAEAALRSSEQWQRQLLALVPVAVYTIKAPGGEITYYNENAAALWGREPVLGDPGERWCGSLRLWMPDGSPLPHDQTPMTRVLAEGCSFRNLQLMIERPDASRITALVNIDPILDGDGRVVGAINAFQDVTLLQQAEQALRESEAQLQRAARAKDEFIAMLSHELRNPLAPITTTLQLMKLRAPDVFVRERDIIEAQVRYLTGLVDDLLDVARIARGKIDLKMEAVEIAKIVAAAVETTQPLMEERRQSLLTEVERGLMVRGDARRLVQVLVNLLGNAAKYSPKGRSIHLTAALEGGEVALRVRDEGQGIEPERLSEVFEMFTQDAQSIDRSRGGLGLGLAIVRSLVGLHGGSVEVASEGRGKGSEFTVRLPLLEQRRQAPEAVATGTTFDTTQAAAPAKARVLIVDDYALAAESLALLLQEMGYRTRVEHDGAAALQAIGEFEPDVALIDIGLPVMDGYEVARNVRGRADHGRMPLIAITGYGQASDHARVMEAGFDEHLIKPLEAAKIGALIDRLLRS